MKSQNHTTQHAKLNYRGIKHDLSRLKNQIVDMDTKILMITSALLLGLSGIILLFFPQEVSHSLNLNEANSIFFQIFGSLYLGFGLLNWSAREILFGGVYGRAVLSGNFTHFTIGAFALIKWQLLYNYFGYIWILTILYFLFAVLFGIVMMTSPSFRNK